jgi:uncharacterized membrane protein
MNGNHDETTSSKAAIGGHPLHPAVVPFPIAFLVGALVTDIVNLNTLEAFWSQASYWLLVAGLATGVLAAVLGLIDFLARPRVRSLGVAWLHFMGNGTALLVTVANVALRAGDPAAPVSTLGLTLSAIVAVLLAATGWAGGEMVFRHGVGRVGDIAPARSREERDLRSHAETPRRS